MGFIPFLRSEEDSKKARNYLGIKKFPESLEEKLIQCAKDRDNAKTEKEERKIDKRALSYLRRCCKGKFSFLKEGMRHYRDIQRGSFYII